MNNQIVDKISSGHGIKHPRAPRPPEILKNFEITVLEADFL